jgi:phosphoribosylanthranilate isomerase
MIKIKICGICRDRDVDYVNLSQPDYIGFVFAKSRRRVSFNEAARLRSRLSDRITPVGVFVNSPAEDIAALYHRGTIALAQLHGSEDEDYISTLRRICKIPVIKAVAVEGIGDIERWQKIPADFLLLDSGPGGTGKSFDWGLITDIKKPFFLAGGINQENLFEAKRKNPFCIDISSGAETKGAKDPQKIARLVEMVRRGDF